MSEMRLDPRRGWVPKYGANLPAPAAPAAPQVTAGRRLESGGIYAGQSYDLNSIEDSQGLAEFLRYGNESGAGKAVNPETAMRVSAVFRCVALIKDTISTLPLKLKIEDGENRDTARDHPLHKVLTRKPNNWQTPSEFKKLLTLHLLMRGNGYARIVRSMGRIIALIPINPDRVTPVQNVRGEMSYEVRSTNGSLTVLPQRDMLHLRGMSWDGITGISVISFARESVGTAVATEEHGAKFFKNGTHIGAVLKHPDKVSEEAQARLRDSVENFVGSANAHKTIVLEEGMDFAPLGMTAVDAQFIENRKFTLSEICRFFGVPPHMVGDVEKSTSWGSGIEEQTRGFVAYTLQPWLTGWEEAVDRDCLTDDEDDYSAKFELNALYRGDLKARFGAYVQAVQNGILSPDEVRRLEDRNPRTDGKGGHYNDPPNTAGTPAKEKDEKDAT